MNLQEFLWELYDSLRTLGYIVLFLLIQLVSAALILIGTPLLAVAAFDMWWKPESETYTTKWHWSTRLLWLWDNEKDGIAAGPTSAVPSRWAVFVWSALRNPVNNLRFVPGVSKAGRPLYRKTWGAMPGGWYFQAGWNSSGYPVMSGGRNVHNY